MMLHEADDRTLPLWRSGSATLVRHREIDYVITTRHKLGIERGATPSRGSLDTIRISSGGHQLSNIPVGKCIYEEANPEEEFHDILVFETAPDWNNKFADSPYFFPLTPFSRAERRKSFLVGYPTVGGGMDEYHEAFYAERVEQIHIKRYIGDCDLDREFKSNADHFRRYSHSRANSIVDGCSGGAVFSVIGGAGEFEIVLDGIIVRGGAHSIYVVDVDYLLKVVPAFQE
jgi:hypothetical protein